ncbi:uncharacterized protein LOC123686466 isoform X1 [Harmonia axyridis]|uniref:uncharacterized protein LOC123686466 isoform X1 n=2 Tax=Harmonia axyridis TaxID=115357 RepID=UPI001E276D61|nr:uncharacterized protein LOC123686466 isoform X1 [Harmonia axyridis]
MLEMKVLFFSLVILAFWTCYFMYDMADKERSCVNVTRSMYCPKNLTVAQGEVDYYHTIAISSLAFCFMITLHLVFSILNHQELSMLMMMTTSILIALFAFSHWGVENFIFHCLGFVIGVYGANFSILVHLLYIYWRNRRLSKSRSMDTVGAEDGDYGLTDTIELRNNQPGFFFDINTGTHILNFDIN